MSRPTVVKASALFVLFFVVGLVLHHQGFDAPMTYDSRGCIQDGRPAFESKGLRGAIAILPQRPLPMITFYLNFLVRDMKPFHFRVFNVGLLAAASVMVAILMDLFLSIAGPWNRGSPSEKTFFILFFGLLFLVHPLQTYLALYIWQRTALMACLFYFSALALYLAIRCERIRNKAAGYGLCLMFFVWALLSKENACTLPAILLLLELAFFRTGLKGLAVRAGIYGLITGLLIGLISFFHHPYGKEQLGTGILNAIALYYKESGLTLTEVALTQCRVLFQYLSIIIAPLPSKVLLTSPQVLSRSLLEPWQTLPAVIGTTALVGAGICLLRTRPLAAVGILFYVINLMPEALLVPQYAFFAYRAVLPMFGLFLVAADAMQAAVRALDESPVSRRVRASLIAMLAAIILIFAGITSIRAVIWSDGVLFWKGMVEQLGPSDEKVERLPAVQALNNLGLALMAKGRYLEAAETYEMVLKLEPDDPRKRVLLAAAYAELGKINEAELLFKEAIGMKPDYVSAHMNYGTLLMKQNRLTEAIEHFRKAADLAPGDPRIYRTMGEARLVAGDYSAAVTDLRRSVELDPRSHVSRNLLGYALLGHGNIPEAADSFRKALELEGVSWESYNGLGMAEAAAGRLKEAAANFGEALKISPGNEAVRLNLERLTRESANRTER